MTARPAGLDRQRYFSADGEIERAPGAHFTAAQRPAWHTARSKGITHPRGGHIGGGVAWHAAWNRARQARLAARCVQPGQHA